MKKENMNRVLSYLLVALMSVILTIAVILGLFWYYQPGQSKLIVLEQLILDRFVEEVDPVAIEDAAAHAMVNALGDRWSYYIPADYYQSYLEKMRNAYVDVGITISSQNPENGILIQQVIPGGSAEEAGVCAQDIIIKIDKKPVIGMTLEESKKQMQGKAGTVVELTVQRGSQELTLQVTRREIKTPVVKQQLLSSEIGLITILNFNENCAAETISAIQQLIDKGAKKLIFDVRNNPGGYAEELVKVLDYLLPEGKIFTRIDYAGREYTDMSDAACVALPMTVIVNKKSYSAAEFFAAVLAEYEVATVVGEKTVGKGYFQSTYALPDGSAVGLSVGKYFTPKGVNLADKGIAPDVPIPLDEETSEKFQTGKLQPMEDPQILAAIDTL